MIYNNILLSTQPQPFLTPGAWIILVLLVGYSIWYGQANKESKEKVSDRFWTIVGFLTLLGFASKANDIIKKQTKDEKETNS